MEKMFDTPHPLRTCQEYFVTMRGLVISTKTSDIPVLRKTHIDKSGYKRVTLYINGRRICRLVHQLVAETFLGEKPTSKHEVRHLDGNPLNNDVSNLAWGTRSENCMDRVRHGTHWVINNPDKLKRGKDHWTKIKPERIKRGDESWSRRNPDKIARGSRAARAKLSEELVLMIVEEFKTGAVTKRSLSVKYGISFHGIKAILSGRTWGHLTGIRRNK